MPTLEDDTLVFRFPEIDKDASFSIDFQRTLRIPDTDKTYSLPPGLGSFPLRHAEDFASNLPSKTSERGGVILPMWQAEAMWLHFRNDGPEYDLDFPVAIKIAAGKINAVTGEAWRPGLHRAPQDYMVSPDQPWLDGFAIEKGVIRQFVAMPLGAGYSVEEQLTSESEWGGIQISVTPLKAHVWKAKRDAWEKEKLNRKMHYEEACLSLSACSMEMGLAAGGRMRQEIYPDTFNLSDWDQASAQRVFVTLVHAKDWKKITGDAAPNEPPTAKEYSAAGLPWFEYYGKDREALPGGEKLGAIKSVAKIFTTLTGASLPNSQDIETGLPHAVGPGSKGARPVRTSGSWDQ
jgi:hypothetical protein